MSAGYVACWAGGHSTGVSAQVTALFGLYIDEGGAQWLRSHRGGGGRTNKSEREEVRGHRHKLEVVRDSVSLRRR